MSERSPADVPHPTRIGAYELVLPIGTGGMGTVYLARREVVPGVVRDFALKVFHPQLRADSDLRREMLHEAKLAAGIRHPNVVQVIEAIDDGKSVVLVMDYVDGDTLAGLIRHTSREQLHIPLPVAARILSDALEGLHAAHEARSRDGRPLGLVHRDFSPQNILVGIDGNSRLTDFGIAKVTAQAGVTATGVAKGKVSYMAPEQALGKPIDRRCDLWAAGVVLWETLASRRLFRAENEMATVMKMMAKEPPPFLCKLRPELPPAVDDVVRAALVHDASRRIGTAAALRSRLLEAVGELAERDEVGQYLRRTLGEQLERRREQVVRAANQEHPTGEIGVSRDLARRSPKRRLQWIVPLAAALALAAWWSSRPSTPTLGSIGANVVLVASEVSRVVPERERSPTLRVNASEPIVQVSLGDRSIVLPAPTRSFEVALTGDEVGSALSVRVTTRDGRQARVEVEPNQTNVAITLPPVRPKPVGGKPQPGFIDEPYGNP